jgi:predicted transcriptional regulator
MNRSVSRGPRGEKRPAEAIEQYVEREERRERLRQDALAAWAEYKASGRHVTAAEAEAWLARLEAGEDAEPPSPHD